MATQRPRRRRQQLEIEPLNWVAPDAREDQRDQRVDQDDQDQNSQKLAKS